MKTSSYWSFVIATALVSPASAQLVLFDFDNAPQYTSLPIDQTAGGITAHLSATGSGYSIQAANAIGFTPPGFAGRIIYPNSVFLADLLVSFDQTLTAFSIMYSCQELGCDDAALMRVTAYMNGTLVGSNTRTAANPGTWPVDTLSCSFPQGFNSVVVHYANHPPTCQDYGVIYMADNMRVTAAPNVLLSPKVLLEGPYDGVSQMTDGLRAASLLPNTQPYAALGYTFTGSPGAGGTVAAGVFTVTGSNAIVDWVVVELRNALTPSTVMASCAALVQRDGDVVALDGISPVSIAIAAANYQVAIRHRNHLGCMTSSPFGLSSTSTSVNFTLPTTNTYGTNARKDVNGVRVLWMGDAQRDGVLKYTGANNDRDPILVAIGGTIPTNTLSGYLTTDVNMDGLAKYTGANNDRDPILVNIGGTIPTNTLLEQLP